MRKHTAALALPARETLLADFHAALETGSPHDALIAAAVAGKAGETALAQGDALAALQRKLVSPTPANTPLWRLSEVVGRRIGEQYAEGRAGSDRVVVAAPPGYELLRVQACIENVSDASDAPYYPWALPETKKDLLPDPGPGDTPARWLDEGFIHLLTSDTEICACLHVVAGCALRDDALVVSDSLGEGNVICVPQRVKRGVALDIDVLFVVPQGLEKARLLVSGAAPVAVGLEKG